MPFYKLDEEGGEYIGQVGAGYFVYFVVKLFEGEHVTVGAFFAEDKWWQNALDIGEGKGIDGVGLFVERCPVGKIGGLVYFIEVESVGIKHPAAIGGLVKPFVLAAGCNAKGGKLCANGGSGKGGKEADVSGGGWHDEGS